ncbi:MAG: hypothetical protein F8N36_13775 [Desulfovibrio sp.]|uniref:hypothetical protein n=1 Tax=Desulfovibrio sp. TaxID=885 RepID=UPI00135D5B5D|nr:hypothetical protein [Desulfovibrio sp.]MTJ93907.1 hypothetical protein [Desulfovibrio sp.]
MTASVAPVWSLPGDGFPFIVPNAARKEVIAHWFSHLNKTDGRHLVGTSTSRRRVHDQVTGRRVTRDWVTAHVLLFQDGGRETVLNRETFRAVTAEVQAAGDVDETIIYGSLCLYQSPTTRFEQFGVRSRPRTGEVPEMHPIAG